MDKDGHDVGDEPQAALMARSPIEQGLGKPKEIPDIITFVCSPHWLNRPDIYPRQGTILKAMFLQDELFTQYDYDVIGELSEGFHLPEYAGTDGTLRFQGTHGFQPDLLDRIKINKAAGRKWFRENVLAIGRRGGKGYIGGLAGAYVLWHYLAYTNPQEQFGIDRDRQLAAIVFAGKLAQARDEQWKDLSSVILGAPIFSEYISESQRQSLTIFSDQDRVRQAERESRGIKSTEDMASFQVFPKESTVMSGRGPASFMLFFDEMAHVSTSSGAAASAEDVYNSATPSLDQFQEFGFIFEGSSTWQMSGKFYENWEHSLQVEYGTHVPVYPEIFMVQLTSWDPYKDWENAHRIPMRPGLRRPYTHKKKAIQVYDESMAKLERANPESFAVERRSHWSAAMNAYLNPLRIKQMFTQADGHTLQMQVRGKFAQMYSAHGDPSSVGKNFGLAIAHATVPDANGMRHVIFDRLHFWRPGDFEYNDFEIDYLLIEEYFKLEVLDAFRPALLTFDQFGGPQMLQHLKKHVREKRYPSRVDIHERTATHPLNWKMAEAFKAALNMNLLHSPWYEQAELELTFLQDKGNHKVEHPDSGPVQTDDLADAMINVTYSLIGEQMAAFLGEEFASFGLSAALQGGVRPFPALDGEAGSGNEVFDQFSRFNKARGERTSLQQPGRSPTRDGRPTQLWRPQSPFGRTTVGRPSLGRGK
jgi:hypothetical protein